MREAVKKRLISALQSGHYRQGKGALKYLARDGLPRYCPTGVLCELYEKTTRGQAGKFLPRNISDLHPSDEMYQELKPRRVKVVFSILGYMASPPDRVLALAGITSKEARTLTQISNDGMTFNAIAQKLSDDTLAAGDEAAARFY